MFQNLEIAPVFDMFACWHHPQLPSYFSANAKDTNAVGYNAFNYHHINTPWSMLDLVFDKIIAEKGTVLLVTPRWTDTSW